MDQELIAARDIIVAELKRRKRLGSAKYVSLCTTANELFLAAHFMGAQLELDICQILERRPDCTVAK